MNYYVVYYNIFKFKYMCDQLNDEYSVYVSGLPLTQDIKIPWLFPDLSLTYLHFSLTNQTYKY